MSKPSEQRSVSERGPYRYSRPTAASFTGKGLLGYTFGPLSHKDIEVYYIEVGKGHDTFMISRKITRIYYVLSGRGYFTIAGDKYDVHIGDLVDVPPRVEYSYSGTMTLLAFSTPRWFGGNDTLTRWNPDVVPATLSNGRSHRPLLTRLAQLRICGKSPVTAWLWINHALWSRLPSSVTALEPIRAYGDVLHTLVRLHDVRGQALSTYFLRNRPQLELMRRIADRKPHGDALRIAILGCSIGAEVYSVAWTVRTARPDLKLTLHAVDIAKQAVEFASRGVYSLTTSELSHTSLFERLTASEIEQLFDKDGATVSVKPSIKDGISWHVADAAGPELVEMLGPQDIVVANNFICHMGPREAEQCLCNIARLVAPHGHLFVAGIDLDLRSRVASNLGWKPVRELIEEIHEGDPGARRLWPFHYGGLEPLNKKRRDWILRYAPAFQLG